MFSRSLTSIGLLAVLVSSLTAGCAAEIKDESEVESVEYEAPFVSDVATLMNFDFDGELQTTPATAYSPSIRSQLFYAVGTFNEIGGVARLNRAVLTNIRATSLGNGLVKVTYHAKLPVAWPSKTNLPTSFSIKFPKRIDLTGQQAFLNKYETMCGEPGSHGSNLSNFWYHYRPAQASCTTDTVDVMQSTATVTVSKENVVAKYPEYHRVWEDGALNIVSIWGKYEKGATTLTDAGLYAYNQFIQTVRREFPGVQTVPASIPDPITADVKDITFKWKTTTGQSVSIVALLVDELRTEGAAFDKRYNMLSTAADAVLYNGHAGLGSNIASLTSKGQFLPNKYQLFFMNGCDTFAYVQDSVWAARAALNPTTDKYGTKFLDIVFNAMPAYFNDMPEGSMAFIRALLDAASVDKAPKTFEGIFKGVSSVQVAVGLGTEDNEFANRAPFTPASSRAVLEKTGSVAYQQTDTHTVTLPAGTYTFSLQHDPAAQIGDADLRFKIGQGAVQRCKSLYKNSNEYCDVQLSSSSQVTLTVTGDMSTGSSAYVLRGFRKL